MDVGGNTGKTTFSKAIMVHFNGLVLGWANANNFIYLASEYTDKDISIIDLCRIKPSNYQWSDLFILCY